MKITVFHAVILAVWVSLAAGVSAQTNYQSSLPAYAKAPDGVSGDVLLVTGSRELDAAMRQWSGQFLRGFGHAKVELQVSDSVQAVGRLVDTPGCLGLMSRPMTAGEEDSIRQQAGIAPVAVRVAPDFVVVCVHRDNPIAQSGVSIEKLDAVFSKSRKGGATEDIKTWGQLGLTGEWVDKPIDAYACGRASPLTDFFVRSVMRDGEFKETVRHTIRDGETAENAATNRYAIGFSSLRFCGSDVAVVPVSQGQGQAPVPPVAANLATYPLTRYVYAYLLVKPGQAVDGRSRELLKMIFSKEGQGIAAKAGYAPVTFEFAKTELAKIGVSLSPPVKPAR